MERLSELWKKCCGKKKKKGSVDDSNVDAVIARDLWKNHRILPPTSRFKANWDVFMMVLVFYNCVYIPIELFFLDGIVKHADYPKHISHIAIDFFVDFLFIVDIGLNCVTAYYDEDYEMVLDKKMIRRHYMKFWFWIDLLAAFPFEVPILILEAAGVLNDSNFPTGVSKLFKVPRLLRLMRMLKKLDVIAGANVLRIITIVVFFTLVAHWFACLWWVIGYAEYMSDLNEKPGDHEMHGTSWIARVPGESLTNSSLFEHQYLTSMYWALTTLMKTPSIGPDTVAEKIFASFAVISGSALFAALLGNVTTILQAFEREAAAKREKLSTLASLCTSRKVPAVLTKKLAAYVDVKWQITMGLDDATVLSALPGQLRGSIVSAVYKDSLLKAPLFAKCSVECAKALLVRLTPEVCLQKEVLIAQDQLCQEMYLLMRGAMQVASSDQAGSSSTRALQLRRIDEPGAIVGHVTPFEREVPQYPFLVTALRQSHLVCISRVDMRDVLNSFGEEDRNNVLSVLNAEHELTVGMLSDKPPSRPAAAVPKPEGGEEAPEEPGPAAVKGPEEPSEAVLTTLGDRVTEIEAKLSKIQGDMLATRECTEALSQLAQLINSTPELLTS